MPLPADGNHEGMYRGATAIRKRWLPALAIKTKSNDPIARETVNKRHRNTQKTTIGCRRENMYLTH
jgi:hypothetical protein